MVILFVLVMLMLALEFAVQAGNASKDPAREFEANILYAYSLFFFAVMVVACAIL